jgi:predicted CoA-substrate-specific enzyme activase
MESRGLCIGASRLQMVDCAVDRSGNLSIENVFISAHQGNPRTAILDALGKRERDGQPIPIAVTGRKFKNYLNLTSISEPEAVEAALSYVCDDGMPVNAVVSAGGETFMVYRLDGSRKITSVQTGNKCASGTGEFFLQQIRRMGMSLEEAVTCAREEDPYTVSGRCSVFCKSDCTHATNKGIGRGRVTAGLCRMMSTKIVELIGTIPRKNIMLIGGCVQNAVMIESLRKEIDNLIIPREATYFEALGCALWALQNDTRVFHRVEDIFRKDRSTFFVRPPLSEFHNMVEFKSADRGRANSGDRCIIGLDVGSTTTKAVLMRVDDAAVLASVYLRTEGNPVRASRACYAGLCDHLGPLLDNIAITAVGVTGSGRQIAGLHAMTGGIINEIIAHAAGALHYDRNVDTIFEIGGQDAKYTCLTNGVPSDYAMNEACSAGTGSFLEEAAWETLGIPMEDIADIAIGAVAPPDFNDQCAAFISSDIKSAYHDGMGTADIIAGLVYSICMNYNNRVKGNRPVGKRIFMQGGVCYNRAVPLAMAALTGKHIVVPPDPGLIGAFGVALEVKHRIERGLMKEQSFSLHELRDRELAYGKSFICRGGREKCDRKCEITRVKIGDNSYPFGGACNRWYNIRTSADISAADRNVVSHYENQVFRIHLPMPAQSDEQPPAPSVGINKSFLVNTYFPLYYHFFSRLGLRVILPDSIQQEGLDRKCAAFCYPGEIAHGYFSDLLERKPDYLFLPHFKGDFVEGTSTNTVTCPLSQGEPFYLAAAFKDHPAFATCRNGNRILSSTIDFSPGLDAAEDEFMSLAASVGVGRRRARRSFEEAVEIQRSVFNAMHRKGEEVLADLEKHREESAIVLFGRSYNAFVAEANKGIPNKFASRSMTVIPFHYLPVAEEPGIDTMYWSAGQRILRAARIVKQHPQLFGCYITNFSCGPDSFLVGYFRDIMGTKPSLTLELDSHVADAGLETRIEAFNDIIARYREIRKPPNPSENIYPYLPADVRNNNGRPIFIDSRGMEVSFYDPRVHLVFPSMGRFISEAGSAAFRSIGMRSTTLAPADEQALKLGKGHTSCKECLPLQITVGSLLKYLGQREDAGEKLIYFIPTASGPCRYGQYRVYLKDLIKRLRIPDVALFSSSAENSYADISDQDLTAKLWMGVVAGDIFEEIHATVMANAVHVPSARDILESEWKKVLLMLEMNMEREDMTGILESVANRLAAIEMKRPLRETPVVLLTGEIFVRHDGISRQYIVEELARRGFATKVSTLAEWIYYTEWCVRNKVATGISTFRDQISLYLRKRFMRRYERAFRMILAQSGLCGGRVEDVNHLVRHTQHLIHPGFVGEAILTIGAGINEALDHYCGVIAIGPFGCMPNRVAEAILKREMTMEGKLATGYVTEKVSRLTDIVCDIPFLAIESDGNRFPPIIEAKMEAFLLQAGRVHQAMDRASR